MGLVADGFAAFFGAGGLGFAEAGPLRHTVRTSPARQKAKARISFMGAL